MARRSVALGLALAVVWVTPVMGGRDAGPPPATGRALMVADWADDPRGFAAADGWSESAVVDAGDSVLVGADWGGDERVEVQVRARDAAGWGDWVELHGHLDEHLPDPGTAEASRASTSTASEPVYVGRVDDLQFRVRGGQPRLMVNLVEIPGDLSWTPDAAGGPGSALAAPEHPRIRPRASWGADESLRDGRVDYSEDIRFSVIHHEGGSPRWSQAAIEDGCQQADDAIRAIYAYHTRYRGLWDIAYNFVVDPCGAVWEGRFGGVRKSVMGAHAGGWNDGSFGVLALGTFSDGNSDPVTDEMIEGIENVVAWKLDQHHTDPRGTTHEISGGSTSRYDEGTPVDVPVLSAHTITNATSCPGGVLMNRLFEGSGPDARARVDYRNGVIRNGLPKAYDTAPAAWTAGQDDDPPSWDVTFTEPLDWSLRITDEDDRLVRATGGRAQEEAQRTWDLRDQDGYQVEAGTYTATLMGAGASDVINPVVTDLVVNGGVNRRAGADRVETAVKLSRWAFDEATTVVVASAGAYPDALVASPLAGSVGGPVLLTSATTLSDLVVEEIERLGATRVLVIGGAKAVSPAVANDLRSRTGASVARIGGVDRFETAAKVAGEIADRESPTEVLLALGQHAEDSRAFPDALSAGAFGADRGLPVLLTRGDSLPEVSEQALDRLAPTDVTVFGGTSAINDPVVTKVRHTAAGPAVTRLAGSDRFDTSRLAAEEILRRRTDTNDPSGGPSEDPSDGPTGEPTDEGTETPTDEPTDERTDEAEPFDVVAASGRNWPDALGAGAAAAQVGALFLLVDATTLDNSPSTRTFLQDHDGTVGHITVAGGAKAVAAAVVDALTRFVGAGDVTVVDPIDWPRDPFANQPDGPTPPEPTEEPTEESTAGLIEIEAPTAQPAAAG